MKLSLSSIYHKLLYDTKLRHKLLFTYFVLTIIPLGFFQLLASNKTSFLLERHVHYSAQQGFEQTQSFLDYKLDKISETTDVIVVNPMILEVMENQAKRTTFNQQLEDYNTLKPFIRALQNTDVPRIILSIPNTFRYAAEGENFIPLRSDQETDCIKRLENENQTYLWCSPLELKGAEDVSDDHLYLVRKIRNSNAYRQMIARVKLEIKKETILSILEGANVVKGSVSYLLAPDKQIILTSGVLSNEDQLIEHPDPNSFNQTASIQTGDRIHLYRSIPSSQWTMVTSIPLNEIVYESKKLRNELYSWVIAITAIAYMFAYILAHSITRRISRLIRRLRSIDTGSLISIGRISGKDEIGELIQTYNSMIDRIDLMNREQYKLGQEVNNAQLKALQSQINPHFLYNTLDLINWMAAQGRDKDIQRVIKALSRFYKLSLNNGKDIITIRDELSHVSFYIEIQNARFENKITFITEVDEDILDCGIPKITLQPIVENAIFHGILGRPNGLGTVKITVKRSGPDILLIVNDDGIGMVQERLRLIAQGDVGVNPSISGSGYGIKNVRLRILHYFGESYGIVYRSAPGEGTSVEIRIPLYFPDDVPE
jgi:two-component system sensor histidine kinase YesM